MRDRIEDADDAQSIEDEVYDWLSQEEEDIEDIEAGPKKGRPIIQPSWTRIISLHRPELCTSQPYELSKDLLLNDAIVKSLPRPNQSSILFWPKSYYAGLLGWDIEVHRLPS